MLNFTTLDWYSECLLPMWYNRGWVMSYAQFSGHFVDDFGNLVRVYLPDEDGICHLMP